MRTRSDIPTCAYEALDSAIQKLRLSSECTDENDLDLSSRQSFSSVEQVRNWLIAFEEYLKGLDYYCDNHTTKCKLSTYIFESFYPMGNNNSCQPASKLYPVFYFISDYEYPFHLLLCSGIFGSSRSHGITTDG